jgi:hypothetical protein
VSPIQLSRANAFYEQSSVLSRFLFDAEEGKYRKRLLDYIWKYHDPQFAVKGDYRPLAAAVAFGMSKKELGARVDEYARSILASEEMSRTIDLTAGPKNAAGSK